MRRLGLGLALILTATAAFAGESFTQYERDNCSANNFHWGDEPTFVEKTTVDGSALRSIKASVSQAPISVRGGNGRGYSIEVCKVASRQADLAAIRVTLDGNELRATGPEERRWLVMYRINTPRGADVEVEATNGPLSITDVEGRVVARTANGPLSLRNVNGDVDATTTNGPISLQGGSGTMKVQASNGPLTVRLDGNSWVGGSLDASTKNGPLTVKLPRNYNSGVTIESNGRGPVSCRAEGCERYRTRDEGHGHDADRRLELGHGAEAVRLSTVNGPITVKDEE